MNNQHRLTRVTLAVSFALFASTVGAQQTDDAAIEEVVATASRLQGSAAAVVEERKNQAFVADILGTEAEVYGAEFEFLHDLGYVSDGFFTSGNVTISKSEASIDPSLAGNLTNPTKPMTGHSEYVVNLQVSYDSVSGEHSSSLVYNVFGERILAAGLGGRGDAYEQPFHSVDFVYNYYPDFNSKITFKVKNLLDEDQEVTQSGIISRAREVGRELSVSYSYGF